VTADDTVSSASGYSKKEERHPGKAEEDEHRKVASFDSSSRSGHQGKCENTEEQSRHRHDRRRNMVDRNRNEKKRRSP